MVPVIGGRGLAFYCESMPAKLGVIVDPPGQDGGRRVRIEGRVVGCAYGLWDMVVFLHRAGVEWDEDEIARSDWIEWRGGGPDEWG
jgi:hypothetical protein